MSPSTQLGARHPKVTFRTRFSSVDVAQSILQAARRYSYTNQTTGLTVQLDATVKKSNEHRSRSHSLRPAYVAISSCTYTRNTILMRHDTEASKHYTSISLAAEDVSASGLGIIRYSARGGTAPTPSPHLTSRMPRRPRSRTS